MVLIGTGINPDYRDLTHSLLTEENKKDGNTAKL